MASGDIADWEGNKQQQVHRKMFIEKVDRHKFLKKEKKDFIVESKHCCVEYQ